MNSGDWVNFQPLPRPRVQDVAEQLLGLLPGQEMRLVRRALIGVARRRHDPVHAHRHHLVEEAGHALGLGAVEQGAVDADAEAARLRLADRRDGPVVHALLADRPVVHLAVAVQVHVPAEIGVRLVLLHLLLEQQRVRAEIDELLARQDALDDLRHLLVQQRLAAGDRHHRARRTRPPPPARRRPRGAGSGSPPDSRSCRSRRRPGCSGTAAPASARAGSACARSDAA